jgi:hypothetical protein
MKQLPEAKIQLNGETLTRAQSRMLRHALQIARVSLVAANPQNIWTAGLLENVDDLLVMIDQTEARL